MYDIYHTREYDKRFEKFLSTDEQQQVQKYEKERLKENPYIGDALGPKCFREAKFGVKRVYFIINEDRFQVIMISVSNKNNQQATIDYIKNNIQKFDSEFQDKD